MEINKRYWEQMRRSLRRVERKIDIATAELMAVSGMLSERDRIGEAIEGLHDAACSLREQARRDKEILARMLT